MSITFWVPDAPEEKVACEWCATMRQEHDRMAYVKGRRVGDTKLTEEEWATVTCERFCSGEKLESTLPSYTFSNTNAFSALAAVGLPTEYGGTIEVKDLDRILAYARLDARLRPVLLAAKAAGHPVSWG
jgi:hypothetical protein